MLALLYTLLRISSCSNSECHISSDEIKRLCLGDTSVENNTPNNSLLENSLFSDTIRIINKAITEPIENDIILDCINTIRLMLSKPDLPFKTLEVHLNELVCLFRDSGVKPRDNTIELIENIIFYYNIGEAIKNRNMEYEKAFNESKALLEEVLNTIAKKWEHKTGDTKELTNNQQAVI